MGERQDIHASVAAGAAELQFATLVEHGVSGNVVNSFRKELPDVDGWKTMPSHAEMSMVLKRTLPANYKLLLKAALVYRDNRSRLGIEKAKKLVMVAHHQEVLRKETIESPRRSRCWTRSSGWSERSAAGAAAARRAGIVAARVSAYLRRA